MISGVSDNVSISLTAIRKYKIAKLTNSIAKFKKESSLNLATVSYYKKFENLQKEEVFENTYIFKKYNITYLRIDRSFVYINNKVLNYMFYIDLITCIIADLYGEEYYRKHAFRIDMTVSK